MVIRFNQPLPPDNLMSPEEFFASLAEQKTVPDKRKQQLEETFDSCYSSLEKIPGWKQSGYFNLIFLNSFSIHQYPGDILADIKQCLRFDGWLVVLSDFYIANKELPESLPFYYVISNISSPPLKNQCYFNPCIHKLACCPRSYQSIIHGIKTSNYVSAASSGFFGERDLDEGYPYPLFEYLIEALSEPEQRVLFINPDSILGPLCAKKLHRLPFAVLSDERKEFSRKNLLNY